MLLLFRSCPTALWATLRSQTVSANTWADPYGVLHNRIGSAFFETLLYGVQVHDA